ncbi:response regulator transcription factor [Cohnella silvisoli]|uniref:Helix-turn-helix domain-containing protein n=1 Tax=Cohnella silvisoli TaxID=2873699 RepID=A0ABV1L1Z1_9BACL|nr:helix-turn-helix domain-containing protein [Cohnella silvisoli]MCD9025710.1 helix-turn-helix domain-containing protein [Cohnella silvisoli]
MIQVMVVDDEHLVRRGIVSTFPWERFGMSVAADASGGKKALQLLGERNIDLLFVDLTMPLMSGFQLIEQVNIHYPHVVCVVLTCHQEFRYIQDALRLGAVDYIIKTELEQDNIERILTRIRQRMSDRDQRDAVQKEEKSSAATVAPSVEEELEVCRSWTAMDWVLSVKLMNQRLEQLIQRNWPYVCHQRIMEAIIKRWNQIMHPHWVIDPKDHLQFGRETDRSWEQFKKDMYACRDLMESRIMQSGYFADTLEAIVRSLQYIHRQEQLSFTIGAVAREIGMSTSYFSKVFKDVTGRTFSEYMKAVRVERAKERLSSTKDPIYVIARNVGYEDEKYFSKTFREHVGMLPSEYRQKESEFYVPHN